MASLAPSSPRLPSPPPPAEIQIGPKPPSAGSMANRQVHQMEQTAIDANSKRRIHPGTKAADMAAGPPLVPLSELDSAFQLQEHLAALHYHHTATNTNPVNRETAKILATPPPGIDRTLWLYELCRFLIEQCNGLIVGFLFDTPPCSAATCPEMRASEWQFLCAVHDQPKSCCAIDYCCHTLDWAANVVTNPQIFPSRFVALSDAHDKGAAVKNLVNVFRRLHRIFAHAWFQHRGVFWTVEGQTGLYVFFKTVCDIYDLLPGENYKLPPEAEGLEAPPRAVLLSGVDLLGQQQAQQQHGGGLIQPTSIVRPRSQGAPAEGEDDHLNAVSSRTSTRRHIRSSPSTGSAVTTVMEADEDEGGASDMASRFREMRLAEPSAAVDDPDGTDVPVIVEHRTPLIPKGGHSAGIPTVNVSALPVGVATLENPDISQQPERPQPSLVGGHDASEAQEPVAPEPLDQTAGSGDPATQESLVESPDLDTPIQPSTTEQVAKEEAVGPKIDEKTEVPSETEPGSAADNASAPPSADIDTTDFADKTILADEVAPTTVAHQESRDPAASEESGEPEEEVSEADNETGDPKAAEEAKRQAEEVI